MTERERWIVYPLLFLALGAALRDKLSEHTETRRLECQELIVFGEDGPGQPRVPLVEISGIKRDSADQPHLGQLIVNGLVQANEMHAGGIQAQDIQASRVNADNYFFHRIPLSPVMRAVPGASAVDPAQLQQLQQQTQPPATNTDEGTTGDDASKDKDNDAKAPPAE
jgi:hypothetical protein